MKQFVRMMIVAIMAMMTVSAMACDRKPASGSKRAGKTGVAQAKPARSLKTNEIKTTPGDSQIDTLAVYSKMGRPIKNLVVKPEIYNLEEWKQFPVVYLLHGYDGDYTNWSQKINLKQLANRHGFIIVCPDGQDSWYFDSPIDPKMRYETYMTLELISAVDSCYRTNASRSGRAITGLSMGGHGALWLAWRHTDIYGACGSMSGGVDITKFPDKWKIHLRLGKYATNKDVWASHSVASLVPTLENRRQAIIFDDGDKDFFYDVNMALHKALKERGIDHRFDVRPGNHSWQYWTKSLPVHLEFFSGELQSATHLRESA